MKPAYWIVGILAATALYLIAIYNRLVSLRQRADGAWSDIQVQLKRRANLIPALIETVRGYRDYEAETLEKVVRARDRSLQAGDVKSREQAEAELTGALRQLFALSEAYPDLKASETFAQLQKQLAQIEEAIQNARRYYNAVVRDYNTRIDSFPDLFVARKFGFRPREFFELDEGTGHSMPSIDLS